MLNRFASFAMSTSILKALPGKLDIKRHSPSIIVCMYKSSKDYNLNLFIPYIQDKRENRYSWGWEHNRFAFGNAFGKTVTVFTSSFLFRSSFSN